MKQGFIHVGLIVKHSIQDNDNRFVFIVKISNNTYSFCAVFIIIIKINLDNTIHAYKQSEQKKVMHMFCKQHLRVFCCFIVSTRNNTLLFIEVLTKFLFSMHVTYVGGIVNGVSTYYIS